MKTKLFPLLLALGMSIAAPFNAPAQCLINPAAAVACWNGEGHPNDVAGLYPATWTGTPDYAAGKVGSAFRLDGTNYLRVNDANALSPGAAGSSFTVEAWINPIVWSGAVVAKGTGSGLEYSLSLNRTNGNVVFSMALTDPTGQPPPPPQTFTVSGGVGASNQWHHIAGVFQPGNSMAVFLDGARVGTLGLGPTLFAQNTTALLYLGRAGSVGQNLAGQLDEVCLLPFALGDSTIQAIYAASSLGKCPPTNCVTAPTNLVAWWPAEGNAADVVGNRSGVAVNGATYAPGRVGQAFRFDGVNDYVDCPNTVSNLGQFTFEFWVRINSFTDPFYMPLFGQTPASYPPSEPVFNFTAGSGASSFGFSGQWRDNTSFDLRTNIPFGTNVWKHITVTYDGNTLAQFVDGQLLNQGVFAGKALGNSRHLFLGRAYTYPGSLLDKYLDGWIDEFSVYQRALNPTEIQFLYAAGANGKCNTFNADCDGDGLSDAYEIANGMNPCDPPPTGLDSDGDGLTDEDEINIYHTNPNNPDTDGDGETDGMEVQMGTDPRDPNSVLHLLSPTVLPGGVRRICWISQGGRTYELQCADLRTNGPGGTLLWVTRTNVTALGPITCVEDRLGSMCAYRVRLVPSAGADTLAPVVGALQLLSYVPGATAASLSVIARDIVGVTAVDLLDGNTVLGSATRLSGDIWRFTWNLNVNLNGRHYLRARARDAAGNYGYSPTLAFDVGLAGGSCIDIGPVRICADSVTLNAGVYSFSGNIRINGIRLNAGATVTASGSTISGTGGVNVPGVGTVFSGTFDVNTSTGWLTVRPSPVATYNIVTLNSRISLTPRSAAINVFTGAIQGAGAATVQVPGHTYGAATFDGSFSFDPGAAKLTVTGTFSMGTALSGSGTAMLNLADSTFMLSGSARFISSNGDAYTVSNGVATLYYAAAVPYVSVSGKLGIPEDMVLDVQGTLYANGSVNLMGSGQGTISTQGQMDGFTFSQISGTLTRPAGASAAVTVTFNGRLVHPNLINFMVSGSVRSTGDIDIMGNGQAIFRTNLLQTDIVAEFPVLNVRLRGNYLLNNISNAISGVLATPNYLKPVTFTGIMRADGSVDITGNSGPYTAASFSGGVPAMDAPGLSFEERLFIGCYHLFSRNNNTTVNVGLHLVRTSEAAGGVCTLTASATATTPGLPTLTLTGMISTTGAFSLTGSLSQQTAIWGYQVSNLACTVSRQASGVVNLTITGGTLGYAGLVGVVAQTTGNISSDGSGYISFVFNACTLDGFALSNINLRLAQAASPSTVRTLTVFGTGLLSIPGFPSVTAQVSGSMTNDGTYRLSGNTSAQMNFSSQPVAFMVAGSSAALYRNNLTSGLSVTGTVGGGLLSGSLTAVGTAAATARITSAGVLTLSGCITVEPLVFDQFRLESTQAGGRFSACFSNNSLTLPSGARLLYRGAPLTTPALPSITFSANGNFSVNVLASMTLGITLNGYSFTGPTFTLTRSGGVLAVINLNGTVGVAANSPGLSSVVTFGVSGSLNSDGTYNLTGTTGGALSLAGLPIASMTASASVNLRDTGLTVSGSCSGNVLNTLPAGFTATATLAIASNGIIMLSGSVTCSPLQSGVIIVEASGGGNLTAALSNTGLGFSGAQVRVTGVFSASLTLPGFPMNADGSFSFPVNAGSPSGFTIGSYGITSISFTLIRISSGILLIDSIGANLNVSGFNQRLTGSINNAGTVTLDFSGAVTLGGFSTGAGGHLALRNTGLTASGTLDLTAAGHTFGSLAVSGSITVGGNYTLNGSATLNLGGWTTTAPAALKVSPTGVFNGDNPSLGYGLLPVRLPNYSLNASGISLVSNPTAAVDSGWQGFNGSSGPVNGRVAGTVSLSIPLNGGTVTANFAWTLAYWFDCPGCTRPTDLNDSRLDGPPSQKWTSSGSIDSTGAITLNHSFGGVPNWFFDLW